MPVVHQRSTSLTPPTTATATGTSQPPSLPPRPSTLNNPRPSANYYGNGPRLAPTPYGGIGGYNSYASPYSRFGGMGSSMYGGLGGGYGSMYGGIGGMGGMYGSMGGPGRMGMDPNDPNSLTNSFSQSTQATFQIIESLVGAFGGFAQMLESTYMATHSSFFAMVSVADQFANLRTTLGSILGIFTLLRWLRTLFAKITGRPPPADATSLTPSAFAAFRGFPPTSSSGATPTPSRKPFLVFLLAVFGLPYLLTKLIRSLASPSPSTVIDAPVLGPDGTPLPDQAPIISTLVPSKLDFCRALYDYAPPPTANQTDLSVKKGDLVAVLSKTDPMGRPSEWWRCRARDGKMGYLPGVYLEGIQRKPKEIGEGRADTMSSDGSVGSMVVEGAGAVGKGKEKEKGKSEGERG